MARDPQLQHRRKQKILNYYSRLDGIQEHGVKKHTTVWCIAQTADHFDLKPKTIEKYLYS